MISSISVKPRARPGRSERRGDGGARCSTSSTARNGAAIAAKLYGSVNMCCSGERQGRSDAGAISHTFFGRNVPGLRGIGGGGEVRENEVTTSVASDDERWLPADERASLRIAVTCIDAAAHHARAIRAVAAEKRDRRGAF